MTQKLIRPRRKDPLKKTREPLLPQPTRSRTAHGLTAAAAEGRFALQVCADCGSCLYPPCDACPHCLSVRVPFQDVSPRGVLLAETTIRTSTDVYFRERMPWRIGTVALECGPSFVAHLHGDVVEGAQVRMTLRLDKSGNAVAMAMPEAPTAHQEDDVQLRELTCDPKFRRVLVTDGRNATGQAMARAMAAAGASLIFVGIADPWKPFPDEAALLSIAGVEIVPLDVTDSQAVADVAGEISHRVDILVNTTEHVRFGGIMHRHGLTIAREEMDVRYFGMLRLAQQFGPTMRARGADGVNAAAAFVNLLSVHALMNWPPYGAFSAAEAACLSAAQALRAELRGGGVKVLNMFTGPLETEWFQSVPPPKVAPAALASATVDALRRGVEDAYVGDIAQDIRARLDVQPKALERELGL
ncbi:SDR family oxidoreductase [Rhodopila sp.]|uniref:SDR family oxidoreductase n=1 Tax=Rhodopila sp. TaxID=2480087 RepID=UPI003D130C8D